MDRTYIGLLRGINVGGEVLRMTDLKQAVAGLGFESVRTYLQSGNLVFRAARADDDALASRISASIRSHAALDVHVIVRADEEWDNVIAHNPFPGAEEKPKTIHVFLFDRQPEKSKIEALRARDFGSEDWKIVDGTLYLHTPDGFGKSKLGGTIERTLKVPMTARNWNTVLALKELASGF